MITETAVTANSIGEVIERLDAIVDWSRRNKSRIGYFATLYRKMTIAVRDGIANNIFSDGNRMEKLDIIFANRYLTALDAYINKRPCTNAWCTAFDASENEDLIVLQHLLLGINTHINLDLCIAASEACPKEEIHELEEDFNKINHIIASLIPAVQDDLCEVWHPLRVLAAIANHHQEAILNFSISVARRASWQNAVILSGTHDTDREKIIRSIDENVVELAGRIMHPGIPIHLVLLPVLKMESRNVPEIIDMLC